MTFVLAVDPGDVHVGIAYRNDAARYGPRERGDAFEELADQAPYRVNEILDAGDILVIEEFRLYPDKAAAQTWSAMKTPELIGALKWIAAQRDARVIMQPASIKIPTRQQCKARGIHYNGADSIHAKDAWLHLMFYCLRNTIWGGRND